MVAVWVVAFEANAVTVPGPLPLSSTLHSPPAASTLPQLPARVKLVAVTERPVASAEPRLRSVTIGAVSIESASEGAAAVESFAR